MSALYIHIPFCNSLCGYCDFYKSISRANRDPLPDAIKREMQHRQPFLSDTQVKTIYFGGGTPSVYAPDTLQEIISEAKRLWDCSAATEITAETNPDDLTEKYLKSLAATDINRLSIGIQSFIDRDLQFMNRRHNAAQAINAVRRAQQLGFDNISIDLIYGIPGMTLEEWVGNIRQAIELNVQHISAYHLTIEQGTVFGKRAEQGRLTPIAEESSEEQYLLLHTMLSDAGFEHYEISNFAKAGFRSRHNSTYWSGDTYLGVGPSAHSYDGNNRSFAIPSVDRYIQGVGSEKIYESEALSATDRYNEYIMVSLRTSDGIDIGRMNAMLGESAVATLTNSASEFMRSGLLVSEEGRLRIPPEHFLVSDSIIAALFKEE